MEYNVITMCKVKYSKIGFTRIDHVGDYLLGAMSSS